MINEKQEITVMGEKVVIDPDILQFNQNTLPDYLIKEAGYYAYYGAKLADAEAQEQYAAQDADNKSDTLFWLYKSEGQGSDKYCECKSKTAAEVQEAREKCIALKRNVTMLRLFLRAMDKNHDNAQSMGHNLRKELDKMNSEIRISSKVGEYERKLEEHYGSR